MPVITFASPKGGAGKTTAALLLSTELATKGFSVTVIDADPLNWISSWGDLPGKPDNLEIVKNLSEDNIIDEIEAAKSRSQFVITDLEGTASTMAVYALSRSDQVLIPIQPSDMDAKAGAMVIKLIRKQEQAFRTEIPFSVFMTKTKNAIQTRTLKNIAANLERAHIPIMKTQLFERETFRSLFSFGGTLQDIDPRQAYKVEDAIANARLFAAEVFAMFNTVGSTEQSTKEVAA